jgi:hypothetical protein
MLDDALALYRGEAGESIDTAQEEAGELGIDPEEVEAAREENDQLPDFMQ